MAARPLRAICSLFVYLRRSITARKNTPPRGTERGLALERPAQGEGIPAPGFAAPVETPCIQDPFCVQLACQLRCIWHCQHHLSSKGRVTCPGTPR